MSDTEKLLNTIPLEHPITRGDTDIESLTLRKPVSGELRGLKLSDLLQMDVSATITVLPRISSPTITEAEAAALDPADLMQCAIKISGMLVPKSVLDSPSA